jgi:hemerythrin-like domain-containing protein
MKSIDTMVFEHENIRRMLKVIRVVSYRVLTEGEYSLDDYSLIADFVKGYADKLHHGKEEDILFEAMNNEIQKLAKSGAITGMYIEHDQGRLFIANLLKGVEAFRKGDDLARLDIIANSIAYSDLLDRHIEKENTALYKFAEKMLSDETKIKVDENCNKVEEKALSEKIQEKYLALLESLEIKYLA